MEFSEIENNVKRLKDEISAGNAYGEAVTRGSDKRGDPRGGECGGGE